MLESCLQTGLTNERFTMTAPMFPGGRLSLDVSRPNRRLDSGEGSNPAFLTVDIHCHRIGIEATSSDKKLLGARQLNLPRTLFCPVLFISLVNSQNSQFWWVYMICLIKEKPVSIVCSKCKKSLTVKESILKAHQCGHLRSKVTPSVFPVS